MGDGDGVPHRQPVRPAPAGARPAEPRDPAHAGPAAPGGRGGDRGGARVEPVARRPARLRVPRADGGAVGRGAVGRVGGDRRRPRRVDGAGNAHEGEAGASRTAGPPRPRDPRPGATARRPQPVRVHRGSAKPLSEKTLRRLLGKREIAAVPHGFRSSSGTGPPKKRIIPARSSRRPWRTWCRTRSRRPTGARTCSSAAAPS